VFWVKERDHTILSVVTKSKAPRIFDLQSSRLGLYISTEELVQNVNGRPNEYVIGFVGDIAIAHVSFGAFSWSTV